MKVFLVYYDSRTPDGYGSRDVEKIFTKSEYAKQYIEDKAREFAEHNIGFMKTEEQEAAWCRSLYSIQDFRITR